MNWRVVVRPEAGDDVEEAATWYDERQPGLGSDFTEEILKVFDALELNPLLNCRRHPRKNIRWRYPERFPYRVIYEVREDEKRVVVAAVLHAARHDRQWQKRI
ncbi:MAG: type II toxin-antitoxin system RelE/ParE family toxin [Verrucomicrobia bacterium]|nr:MAG: type II toxin-antitoxin system RelE/ParE family toxin [Verrucomicrobiota bacterium]